MDLVALNHKCHILPNMHCYTCLSLSLEDFYARTVQLASEELLFIYTCIEEHQTFWLDQLKVPWPAKEPHRWWGSAPSNTAQQSVQKSQNWTQSSDDMENKSGNLRYKSTHLAESFKDFATPGTQMPLKFFNWAIYTLHVPKTTHLQLTSAIAPRLASRTPVTSLSNCAESTGCRLFRRKWEDGVPELEWWFFNSVFWTETNHVVHRHKQCTIVNMIFVHIKWSATEPTTGCSTDFMLSIPGKIESWLHTPSSQMFLTAHLCFWSLRNGKRNPFFGTAMFLLNTWPCY